MAGSFGAHGQKHGDQDLQRAVVSVHGSVAISDGEPVQWIRYSDPSASYIVNDQKASAGGSPQPRSEACNRAVRSATQDSSVATRFQPK